MSDAEIETRPDDVDPHWKAAGALDAIVRDPEKAVRIDSNPNPMYVTVDDGELAFWCFDYRKKCQVRDDPSEDEYHRPETVVDTVHAYASAEYPILVVSRDEIDDEPSPVATSLGDFEQGGA